MNAAFHRAWERRIHAAAKISVLGPILRALSVSNMAGRDKIRFAFGLALLSGFAALTHELLWTRRLIDLLGASPESTGRVFGFFFLGLALGSAIAARRINRVKRPWRALALAETGIAVFALPMLFLPRWSDWIWPALGMEHLTHWPGMLVKTIVSGVSILPPAICMGLVLPFLSHGLLRSTHRLDTDGVRLYAVNTLGGALGLLAAVLCLLPSFGAVISMACAMALNLVVAAGAFVLDGRFATTFAAEDQPRQTSAQNPKPFPRVLLAVAFFSATGILAAEVVANQMFMLVATLSFYAPAVILFAVISSLAAGAFLAPGLRRRAIGISPASLIAAVMGIAALLLAAGPLLFMAIVKRVDMLEMNGSLGEFITKLALLAFVSLGPGFVAAGLVFPLTISWLAEDGGDEDGKQLGWLLAANGLGGLVGAEAAYRILLPLFDIHAALGVVAVAYALAGLALSLFNRRPVSWIASHAGIAATVALVLILGLRPLPLISKRFGIKLLDHHSGREGSVAVVVENDGVGRCMVVDNQYVLGGSSMRMFEEQQANLPLLLHPAPADVAFIGLATGITPGAALLHSNLNSITVVELSPLVVRAAEKFFGEFNHNITQSKRATVVVDDGRTAMASAPARFDMVIGDLFLPWAPGEARLYSVEHFRDVRRSLRPGGLFCQWLAMYQFTPPQFEIVADTFQKVFPRTYLFCNTLDTQRPMVALVGFQDDQPLNWLNIAERCAEMQKNESLNRNPWLRDSAAVARLYLGEWKPPTSDGPVAINTLGNLLIELDAGRTWLTVGPQTRYFYGRRWLHFCHQRHAEMAAGSLPMNSPVTLSSLEGADDLMRQVYQMQSGNQAR
jgi:spermidine synthase